MKSPNIDFAVKIYYAQIEIGTAEICEMFDCSRGTAIRLKNAVRAEMAKRHKSPFVPNHVSTSIAFDVWGLDIADLERRCKKIKNMGD